MLPKSFHEMRRGRRGRRGRAVAFNRVEGPREHVPAAKIADLFGLPHAGEREAAAAAGCAIDLPRVDGVRVLRQAAEFDDGLAVLFNPRAIEIVVRSLRENLDQAGSTYYAGALRGLLALVIGLCRDAGESHTKQLAEAIVLLTTILHPDSDAAIDRYFDERLSLYNELLAIQPADKWDHWTAQDFAGMVARENGFEASVFAWNMTFKAMLDKKRYDGNVSDFGDVLIEMLESMIATAPAAGDARRVIAFTFPKRDQCEAVQYCHDQIKRLRERDADPSPAALLAIDSLEKRLEGYKRVASVPRFFYFPMNVAELHAKNGVVDRFFEHWKALEMTSLDVAGFEVLELRPIATK